MGAVGGLWLPCDARIYYFVRAEQGPESFCATRQALRASLKPREPALESFAENVVALRATAEGAWKIPEPLRDVMKPGWRCTKRFERCQTERGVAVEIGQPPVRVGEASGSLGEPTFGIGEAVSPVGETSRALGETAVQIGEASPRYGEPSHGSGEAAKRKGRPSPSLGEPFQKSGGAVQRAPDLPPDRPPPASGSRENSIFLSAAARYRVLRAPEKERRDSRL